MIDDKGHGCVQGRGGGMTSLSLPENVPPPEGGYIVSIIHQVFSLQSSSIYCDISDASLSCKKCGCCTVYVN